jgi:hypothetical protein
LTVCIDPFLWLFVLLLFSCFCSLAFVLLLLFSCFCSLAFVLLLLFSCFCSLAFVLLLLFSCFCSLAFVVAVVTFLRRHRCEFSPSFVGWPTFDHRRRFWQCETVQCPLCGPPRARQSVRGAQFTCHERAVVVGRRRGGECGRVGRGRVFVEDCPKQ